MNSPSQATASERPSSAALPPPHITWRGAALVAGLWLIYSLLYALLVARYEQIPFVYALAGQFQSSTILALYSVPAWLLVVRQMDARPWSWKIAAHLVIGPLYAWLSVESYLGLMRLFAPPVASESVAAQYQWVVFSSLTIYVIQFALYHAVRAAKRLRLRERQAAELRTLARAQELAALKAQINPHFLFNTLNSINATVAEHPERAREMIADLAGLLRYALDGSAHDRVPLREEVHFAQAYLALESRRFSDRLRLDYDVDPGSEALDTPVPPMLLQPLVENAVRHGIAPREDGGTITLRVARSDGRLEVCVADTGAGASSDPLTTETGGVGLKNTNARLKHTFGLKAALHATPQEPHGFKVWFSIPMNGRKGEWEKRK